MMVDINIVALPSNPMSWLTCCVVQPRKVLLALGSIESQKHETDGQKGWPVNSFSTINAGCRYLRWERIPGQVMPDLDA